MYVCIRSIVLYTDQAVGKSRKPGSATRKVAGAGTPTGASERKPEAMRTNDKTAEKRTVVDQLSFDTKTTKRVAYSQWEFTIVGPFEIEVCNASYGYLKDEHTYRVMIDEAGIPVSCTCKGFKHYHGPNGRVGKHMLAVATVGGQTLLDVAREFLPHSTLSAETDTETAAEKLKTDGGAMTTEAEPETCPNGEPYCDGPKSDDLPCFDCFERGSV